MKTRRSVEEPELNLAPVIDCFTVLVTFMLASAAFLSVGVLDVGLGAPSEKAATDTTPQVLAQAELGENHEILIKLSGKVNSTIKIDPAGSANYDSGSLKNELTKIKQHYPELESLVLSASDEVAYLDLVKVMDEIRGVIPNILLGGF